MRVLIVEDNRRLAESIRDILKHCMTVISAGTGIRDTFCSRTAVMTRPCWT